MFLNQINDSYDDKGHKNIYNGFINIIITLNG